MWRFDQDCEADQIAGFGIEAFTPEGAAIKAYNRGFIRGGLKNYVVTLNGATVARLYPMLYPLLMLLDAPVEYAIGKLRG